MTSERYADEVDPFLAIRGWTRQGDELARYVRDAKWLLDDVEPLNLLGQRKPPRMLLQMAIGDTIIPNPNTESLGDVTGEHVEGFVPSMDGLMGHGFIVLPFATESVRCRQDILDFFAAR